MATISATAPIRPPEAPRRATFLELAFDLALVAALFQLSHYLVQHLHWSGAAQSAVLLLTVWRIWIITTWITDRLDPQRLGVQLCVVVTLTGTLLLSAAMPEAFGEYGWIFAGVYVGMHIGRHVFLGLFLRGRLQRVAWAALVWAGVSAVPWIAGALTHGALRVALWTLAIALDYLIHALDYPLPGAGRKADWDPPVAAEHVAERYQQVFIIALGELILVSALTLGDGGFAPDRTAAFLVSIATAALLARIYIARAEALLHAATRAIPGANRISRWAGFTFLFLVAGIVVTAVGDELVIAQPTGRTGLALAFAILGGPALYLAGRGFWEYLVYPRVSWTLTIGLLVLAALVPVALHLPPILAATAAAVVLAGVAVADVARSRAGPAEAPSPRAGEPDHN
ncbi:low temperature requirement protein A [Micromonospora sp. NPDC049301]|uniref:low temperature requirement protein A n=1 Tax=Micromonospora sp. NPDC049301 TaxID=3155723 RepID=UPI003441248C